MANACRVPAIKIMGPLLGLSDYSIHAGYYSDHENLVVLRGARTPDDIGVDRVLDAARSAWQRRRP